MNDLLPKLKSLRDDPDALRQESERDAFVAASSRLVAWSDGLADGCRYPDPLLASDWRGPGGECASRSGSAVMEMINLVAGVLLILFGLCFLRKGFARVMGGYMIDRLLGCLSRSRALQRRPLVYW